VLRRTLLAVTIAVVVVASAPAALASFPGSNGRIAFTNAKGQIATSLPDGTKRKTLTHLPGGSAEAPMFSASGAWIVFDRYDGGRKGLYVVKADGTHLHRVVHRPGSEWGPSWSPDGQWITYAANGGGSAIMAARRDGTHIHRLGTHTGEYPRYSPDGKKIVYGDTDGSIHIMRSNGTHNHAITGALGDYPDWSPNGKWIGFSSGGDVWFVHPDGSNLHQVTSVVGLSYSPVFAPNGKRIAYTNGSSVWTSKLDGTGVQTGPTSLGGCCIGWQPR
jgi:Tol biopolymer transport system component